MRAAVAGPIVSAHRENRSGDHCWAKLGHRGMASLEEGAHVAGDPLAAVEALHGVGGGHVTNRLRAEIPRALAAGPAPETRRSQHHRNHARRRLEDCPHGGALQRRRISRARRGCQVPLRVHPPTRPRLGFDAIDKRRDFRGVIGIVSADRCPVATGLAQREAVTAA